MPPPSVCDLDWSDPSLQAVARFGRELGGLIDLEQDTVLVAVSGGADSLALLLLTKAMIRGRCVAATVDHGLRAESAEEAAYVAAICAERGIEHHILTGVLPDRVGRTANLSARARAMRYRLLEDLLKERGLRWLATAHHADDQLETFIMRANRGAGVAGLSGIRRRGAHIIRPLLGWRREELAALLWREGIEPVDDPTNSDARFDRARLRKVLSTVDWLDARRINDAMQLLGYADEALIWAADRVFQERVDCTDSERVFRPKGIPAEIIRRITVRCLIEIDPDCEATGPAVARFGVALAAGRSSMLGNVLASVRKNRNGEPVWTFRPAPPRRSH